MFAWVAAQYEPGEVDWAFNPTVEINDAANSIISLR
jgi:hypothetical protein